MKNILLKNTILLILYTLVYLYFAIFNWQVFAVKLNINLGFGTASVPPFVILFLLGLIIIGILSWTKYDNSLKKLIYELEHGIEISKMRNKQGNINNQELLLDEKILEQLIKRLGINEISKKQDEIARTLSHLNIDQNKEKNKLGEGTRSGS